MTAFFGDVGGARAQGPADRAAGEGDGAGDAALRALGAHDLPLRRARANARPAGLARPPLDGDRLHRPPRPHPRVRARARAGRLRRARARAVATGARSGRPRAISVLAFLGLAELVALPAFSLFFHGVDWRTLAAIALADIGICAVGTLTGAMAVAGRARELLLPLLFLPLAIPVVAGGRGREHRAASSKYLAFLAPLRRRVRPALLGQLRLRRRPELDRRSTIPLPVTGRAADSASCARGHHRGAVRGSRSPSSSSTPRSTPTRAFHRRSSTSTCRSRSPRTHASAGAPGRRCCTSGSGRPAPTSRATSRSTRA